MIVKFRKFSQPAYIQAYRKGLVRFLTGFGLGFFVILQIMLLKGTIMKEIPIEKLVQLMLQSDHQNNGSGWSEMLTNTEISRALYHKTRILCVVMLTSDFEKSRGDAIKRTWGKRCNKLLFIGSEVNYDLETVILPPAEKGHAEKWFAAKTALRYIHEYHSNDYDWVLKAEDRTYTVIENLRYLLQSYSPNHQIYFGLKFKPLVHQGWFCGGAGIVISKAAVRRFVELGQGSQLICQFGDNEFDDVLLGMCMEKLGIAAGDSRDSLKRERFACDTPEDQIFPESDPSSWQYKYHYYGLKGGIHNMSNSLISFNYIQPEMMFALDYLIYNLQPYGVINLPQVLSSEYSFEKILAKLAKDRTNNVETEVLTEMKHTNKRIFVTFPVWTN